MREPERLVRVWFEVWNAGSEEAIDRLMAPVARFHGLSGAEDAPIVGPAAFKPFFRQFRGAFPDLRVEVLQTVVEGDRCAAHCSVTGTHAGAALGLAPTGRKVRFLGMVIVRTGGGTLLEGWNAFDFLGMYQQLGVVSLNPGVE